MNYSSIVKPLARPDAAIRALKDAHFAEEQISVTDFRGTREDASRSIVHVIAPGRDQEAVGILIYQGVNVSGLCSSGVPVLAIKG